MSYQRIVYKFHAEIQETGSRSEATVNNNEHLYSPDNW